MLWKGKAAELGKFHLRRQRVDVRTFGHTGNKAVTDLAESGFGLLIKLV